MSSIFRESMLARALAGFVDVEGFHFPLPFDFQGISRLRGHIIQKTIKEKEFPWFIQNNILGDMLGNRGIIFRQNKRLFNIKAPQIKVYLEFLISKVIRLRL